VHRGSDTWVISYKRGKAPGAALRLYEYVSCVNVRRCIHHSNTDLLEVARVRALADSGVGQSPAPGGEQPVYPKSPGFESDLDK